MNFLRIKQILKTLAECWKEIPKTIITHMRKETFKNILTNTVLSNLSGTVIELTPQTAEQHSKKKKSTIQHVKKELAQGKYTQNQVFCCRLHEGKNAVVPKET